MKKTGNANGKAHAEIDLPDIAAPDPVLAAVQTEMAEAERKCRRLEAVEQELGILRGKIKSMENERARHTATLEAATEERRKFAFGASDGDAEAVERLKRARAAQTEATLQLEDSQSAVDEGRRRFEALEAEQAELARYLGWRDAMKLAKDVLEEARKIDVHLEGFAATLAGHQKKLEALRQMAQDSGREQSFRTVGIRHTMRVFSTRMARIWPLEFEKFSKDYQENTYGQILKMQIANGVGVKLDVESETGATEPTTAIESTEESAQT